MSKKSRAQRATPSYTTKGDGMDASRLLPLGARVTTHYTGAITEHIIVGRCELRSTGLGVSFKLDPPIADADRRIADAWIDSGWFTEVKP